MQLTCRNGAYHGPYEADASPNVALRLAGAALVLAYGILRGHFSSAAPRSPPAAAAPGAATGGSRGGSAPRNGGGRSARIAGASAKKKLAGRRGAVSSP